ncbi:S-adenosylmethionine decarboxylase related protein [Rossellomorea vietnamensis]|uniref:S-adenosylmethionine decarboxylase related protein n=1 Tax=Rossellomorea vietnamensis TaxID=218284 RepID=A0ACD4C212_9BACI|nr:S-adenosylmethionine decarboxylase related protein [Rossellomorea vietnamensis]UXH42605.1 S-adenosylmethionine decarboxylase related protein [Rossellomorea vietnamensis]WQI94086.1 S-adenosylmethionine decarboxylase related protein [Rossellomorea vietnamensis]
MLKTKAIITILGSAGGVAKSVLSILNKSVQDHEDPIHNVIRDAVIYLIDHNQKESSYYSALFPHLFNQFRIMNFDLHNLPLFQKHLRDSNTSIVLDVSWADTVEMLQCCNELGIQYINTALENKMVDDNEDEFEGFPLMERLRIFEENKSAYTNMKGIVCSGMNPGVVQWMAIERMKAMKEPPLACYIVEHDTSFFQDETVAKENCVYTTWSPECFLDEAILSFPMMMKEKTPLFLYENVYDLEFKVTLGEVTFNGCLMPHEEVYTLCRRFNMEGGFLYKVNDHTTTLIRNNLDDVDKIWDFPMETLDPGKHPLIGKDLVGVLLVYNDRELYMYNELSNQEIYETYQTNATYFQVACGIYAGFASLLLDPLPNGVRYVDELLTETGSRYGEYVQYYMKDFVVGKNDTTDGLLLDRMKKM